MQIEKLEKRLAAVEKTSSAGEETASETNLTRRKDGFYLYTDEDAGYQMRLGGGLQADYRHYAVDEWL